MEREQIIKCLEYCKDRGCQDGCPRLRNDKLTEDECRLDLIHETLSLIKELTEENEKLTSIGISKDIIIESINDVIVKLNEENETLKDNNEHLAVFLAETKANTVKKMQERFKTGWCADSEKCCEFIDQIAKEMLEGDK